MGIILDLLSKTESEKLDFKLKFHSNNAELVHDILCLANSKCDSERYIVFGVKETNGKCTCIEGVDNDPNVKNLQQINNVLSSSNLNNIPKIKLLEETVQEKLLLCIEISNLPVKPYFLLSDKREGDVTIRAGVAYSRIGDSNISTVSCAKDSELEEMWKERFNLNLAPIDRINTLLNNTNDWTEAEEYILHNRQSPDYKINLVFDEDVYYNPTEMWMQGYSDPGVRDFEIQLIHNNTVLDIVHCRALDGKRYMLPLPEWKDFSYQGRKVRVYYLLKESIKYKLLALIIEKLNCNDLDLPNFKGYYIVNSVQELTPETYKHEDITP